MRPELIEQAVAQILDDYAENVHEYYAGATTKPPKRNDYVTAISKLYVEGFQNALNETIRESRNGDKNEL